MARNSMRRSPRRSAPEISRYNAKTLRRDRQYGLYWYAWLWKALRPALVFLCSLVIVLGLVVTGWNMVNEHFFMAVDPTDPTVIDFEIEKGQTVTKIGENLYEAGLLRNNSIFKYIIQFQGLTEKVQVGSFPLSKDMDIFEVVDKLSQGSASNERTITIIPGWTIDDIADYFKRQGVIKDTQEFLALANDLGHFEADSYALRDAKSMGELDGRRYQLEGYLAPDTYRVYTNASIEAIIKTLLRQTDVVTDAVFNAPPTARVVLDEFGDTVSDENQEFEGAGETSEEEVLFETTLNADQTIILASIIEREAGRRADYEKVSAVFHNRLERGMRLESDATTAYPLGIHRMVLTTAELETKNGYNTYTRDGLPVGPICNPSKAAIQAALYPDTEYIYDGYIYFCAGDPDKGETVFAKTREEHLANIAKYRTLWLTFDQRQERAAEAAANAG